MFKKKKLTGVSLARQHFHRSLISLQRCIFDSVEPSMTVAHFPSQSATKFADQTARSSLCGFMLCREPVAIQKCEFKFIVFVLRLQHHDNCINFLNNQTGVSFPFDGAAFQSILLFSNSYYSSFVYKSLVSHIAALTHFAESTVLF